MFSCEYFKPLSTVSSSTLPRRQPIVAPHWPAALGARVRVQGHGLGTYVRYDFRLLSRVAHTIEFDEGGERTLASDFRCRDSWFLRRLCCSGCVAARSVASGWQICDDDDLGSVRVSTLVAPDEPHMIKLAPANMSMYEFRVGVSQRFGVPPEKQHLVIQNDGGHRGPGDVGTNKDNGELVGEGMDPSTTVWRAELRSRLLLVAMDWLVAEPGDEGEWSVERIVALRRKRLKTEKARAKEHVQEAVDAFAVGVLGVVSGGLVGGFVGVVPGGVVVVGVGVAIVANFSVGVAIVANFAIVVVGVLGSIVGAYVGAGAYVWSRRPPNSSTSAGILAGVILGAFIGIAIHAAIVIVIGEVLGAVPNRHGSSIDRWTYRWYTLPLAASLGQALEGGHCDHRVSPCCDIPTYLHLVPRTRV